MLELCSGNRVNKHEDIVHNESRCPLCIALEEVSNLKEEIKMLKHVSMEAEKILDEEINRGER